MRIRATKPEFWRSDRIGAVSWEARLVLKALESFVDDNGVGKDDMALILGDLFMRDLIREPSRTLARVSEAISELHEAGLVWRYTDDGTDLLYLSFWESVQRIDKPQAGRFRRPDGTLHYKESVIRESVATPREASRALAPVTGEQGNRGTGEQGTRTLADKSADDDRFEDFWTVYDNKVKKADAKSAWKKAAKKADPDVIIKAAAEYVAHLAADRLERGAQATHQAHASSWLNGERWTDELTGRTANPTQRNLRSVHDLETPPDGMSYEESQEWLASQAERRAR